MASVQRLFKPEDVAQRLVELHTKKAVIEAQYDQAKKQLLEMGIEEILLPEATVKVSESIRFTLDSKAVLLKLGQTWVDDHTNLTQYKQVRVTYKGAAK